MFYCLNEEGIMRRGTWIIAAIMLFFAVCYSGDDRSLDILGMQVPIPGEYVLESLEYDKSIHAQVAAYLIKKPLGAVVSFYQSFLKENAFLVLGGVQPDGSFDASVKKDTVQFFLRIFTNKNSTMVQFIW
jgi:hypothetical protein